MSPDHNNRERCIDVGFDVGSAIGKAIKTPAINHLQGFAGGDGGIRTLDAGISRMLP